MTLHLIKLCVGAESVEDHQLWIETMLERKRRMGIAAEQTHTTRMVPKQRDALLQGGSLYWVIKGSIQARQKLLDIRPFQDDDGISRCHLVLEPSLVPTRPVPRRPFQGWRYLKADDVPTDISSSNSIGLNDIEPQMRRDLLELGLI